MANQATPVVPVDWGDNMISTINNNFDILIQRIADINTTITNLDLVRIQQVYSPVDEPSIDEFMTTCWVKLPVYGGVYCNYIDAGYSFLFNKETIKNGDYLVKMPNNEFIHVQGDTPNCYQPISYDNGFLTFELVSTTNVPSASIEVPQWVQGSNVGHIAHRTFPSGTLILVPGLNSSHEFNILNGRYFLNNEEIVFPHDAITISYTPAGVMQLRFPTQITEYYIPYYDEAS